MNAPVALRKETGLSTSVMNEAELMAVLESSLYPGAKSESIKLVMGYCKAAGLDPIQKPVHIVPMWDSKRGAMRDVIMPGIGAYRTQASRSGQYAGVTEPEFGEDVTKDIGGGPVTFPAWCKVTVKRLLPNDTIAEFSATERWMENYAVKGGKEKSVAPNAMWFKRPYGQLAKCAEAQALRKAFPEFGAQPTADEMEGKAYDDQLDAIPGKQTGTQAAQAVRATTEDTQERRDLIARLEKAASFGLSAYSEDFAAIGKEGRALVGADEHARIKALADRPAIIDQETGEVTQ